MSSYVEIAQQAARSGGEVLLQWQGKFQSREKAPRDLVTDADLASQTTIREIIDRAFPEHGFVGEEDDGVQRQRSSPYRWVVDPLDGTMNYVHGLPLFSVSVALLRENQVVAGAVYDPTRDHCYHAELGQGAFLNDQPLRTSGCRQMERAMTAASLSAHVDPDSPEVRRFYEVLKVAQGVRRLGSAALNLSYVAAGYLDAYFATSVQIWDVAAGLLLVDEAGGFSSQLDGQPVVLERPRFAAASSRELQQQILEVLARINDETDRTTCGDGRTP